MTAHESAENKQPQPERHPCSCGAAQDKETRFCPNCGASRSSVKKTNGLIKPIVGFTSWVLSSSLVVVLVLPVSNDEASVEEELVAVVEGDEGSEPASNRGTSQDQLTSRSSQYAQTSTQSSAPTVMASVRPATSPASRNNDSSSASTKLTISRATASTNSQQARSGTSYGPENAIDGVRETGWQITKGGVGEWIRLDFGSATTLDRIGVVPGYDKDLNDRTGDRWPLNNRVAQVRIEWEGGSRIQQYEDSRQMQFADLNGVRTSWVKLVITDIRPGSRWSDTVVSEIECYGRASGSAQSSQSAQVSQEPAIDLTRTYLSKVTASSELQDGRTLYGAEKVADGDARTAWGAKRDQYRNEWLELSFRQDVTVTKLKMLTGYCSNSKRSGTDYFPINRRIRRARISVGDSAGFEHSFADNREWQEVPVDPPLTGKTVRVTVLDVYQGTKWPDLHVSEIEVWGLKSIPTSQAGSSGGGAKNGMVSIPSATFTMGNNDGRSAERPEHSVTITKAFLIDRTEVTVEEYQRCVQAGRCTKSGIHGPDVSASQVAENESFCNAIHADRSKHPINCVDREQAAAYCAYVGKRLPTEAEWELAARGTDGRLYPWGSKAPACDQAVVSRRENGTCRFEGEGTAPVGSLESGASPYGALDMAGNVWEWVSDGWDSEAYGRSGRQNDPVTPQSGDFGVLRGGSWDFTAKSSSSSFRLRFDHRMGHVSTGFRCASDS